MDPEREKQLRNLSELLWNQSQTQWEATLREHCGPDPDLIREVVEYTRARVEGRCPNRTGPLRFLDALGMPEDLGRYQIEREIGRGSMGVVYKARIKGEEFGEPVAIKVIRQSEVAPEFLEQFRNERLALGRCAHPNIVQVVDDGTTEDGRPYFVMEYLHEALPITDYCNRESYDLEDRLKLLLILCAAVQHAHENGVIHCDLKPANILMTSDGLRIVDFGIARLAPEACCDESVSPLANELIGLGSVDYCSPEQLRGLVTARSDVYALGALTYELLVGEKPHDFQNRSLGEIVRIKLKARTRNLPRSSRNLVYKQCYNEQILGGQIIFTAMEGDPERRFASPKDFGGWLQELLFRTVPALRPPQPSQAQPQPPTPEPSVRARTRTRRAVAIGILCAVGLLFGVIRWNQNPVSPAPAAEQAQQAATMAEDIESVKRAQAEAMWIIFAASLNDADSLISPEVLNDATHLLCRPIPASPSSKPAREFDPEVPPAPIRVIDRSEDLREVKSLRSCTAELAAEAIGHLTIRAQRGELDAATVLAYAYYENRTYLTRNVAESLKWANIAAAAKTKANKTAALYLMGNHYLDGRSVPQDPKEALRWYELAAEKDSIRAQLKLCVTLSQDWPWARTIGRLPNYTFAYVWCSLAASNPVQGERANGRPGDPAFMRDLAVSHLSAHQLSRAQRIVASKHAMLEKLRVR